MITTVYKGELNNVGIYQVEQSKTRELQKKIDLQDNPGYTTKPREGGGTVLHRGFSKYLTAQDTRGKPTLTKHNITVARLTSLLSLQPRSTIKVDRIFFCPSYE